MSVEAYITIGILALAFGLLIKTRLRSILLANNSRSL
jgi:hypothetical protein